MSISNLDTVLNRFGKRVVKESRTALTKKKKNSSKDLYNSIAYEFKESKNSFQLSINMADYGKFIDKGVSGNNDSSFKGKKKTVFRSTGGFRFGSGNFNGQGGEWKKRIDKWMYSKGIQGRDKKGKFIKRDSVNYLIRRSIFQFGTEPTEFFSKPFESAFRTLPNDTVKAYALDMDKFLSDVLK
tara:strand:+ start:710 stop:1261 length:552 start_codon:yes stop_codon:yes gene_type:complete